jgi:nitrous oxide reductase accessory protein NosL
MKKLFSLALVAIVAFVAGCNKADSGATAPATPSTNAPAK